MARCGAASSTFSCATDKPAACPWASAANSTRTAFWRAALTSASTVPGSTTSPIPTNDNGTGGWAWSTVTWAPKILARAKALAKARSERSDPSVGTRRWL